MKMYELPKGFPTLLSAIIRVAVSDIKKVLNSPKHKVDMGCWIDLYGGICHVCLAGAVLIGSIGHPSDCRLRGDYVSNEIYILIHSLDCLRRGNIKGFLHYNISDLSTLPDDILNHQIDPFTYDDNGVKFIEQLESLASKLENYDV